MNGRVGTEVRDVAGVGQTAANSAVAEIGVDLRKLCARGPPKIGAASMEFTPKKIPSDRWDSALK